MVSTPIRFALAATSLLAAISSVSAQQIGEGTYSGPLLRELTARGCFSDSKPLVSHGPYEFQSQGNCQKVCVGLRKPVMGLTNGEDCYCGDFIPSKDSKVDDDKCSTKCQGYNKDTCGGYKVWEVFETGESLNKIPYADGPEAQEGSSMTTSTSAGQTIVKTIAPSETNSGKSSGSSNTVGIAAGVVAGVVGLGAIIGGVFFWLRHKRNKEIDEKERQANAVASFMEGARKAPTSSSSLNDSRLDPDIHFRRQSDGSIADNQDYSRRILQVTNPDGY